MKKNEKDTNKELLNKLDSTIELLQNIFILNGLESGMKKEDVREIVGINMNRVTKINKALKVGKGDGKDK